MLIDTVLTRTRMDIQTEQQTTFELNVGYVEHALRIYNSARHSDHSKDAAGEYLLKVHNAFGTVDIKLLTKLKNK